MGKNVDAQINLLPAMQKTPYHKGVTAAAQLAAGGSQPRDLVGIVPTHAHWDHISGVEDLPGVPVLVTAAGKAFIDSKVEGTQVINSLNDVHYQQYSFDGGPYLGFPSSHDMWGDGAVVIVPAAGHTPDSVFVFINLPSGKRYLMVGDIVFQSEGIELPAEKPWMMRRVIGEDDDQVHRDIALIRSANQKYPQIHPIPAHDSSAFHLLPIFPVCAN